MSVTSKQMLSSQVYEELRDAIPSGDFAHRA